MDFEITKTGCFHKMTLVCDAYTLHQALSKIKAFKCFSNEKDLEFRLHIQTLDLYVPLTVETLHQMNDESDSLLEYRFFTYNDATRTFVTINHQ
jgi:hypothetical protein